MITSSQRFDASPFAFFLCRIPVLFNNKVSSSPVESINRIYKLFIKQKKKFIETEINSIYLIKYYSVYIQLNYIYISIFIQLKKIPLVIHRIQLRSYSDNRFPIETAIMTILRLLLFPLLFVNIINKQTISWDVILLNTDQYFLGVSDHNQYHLVNQTHFTLYKYVGNQLLRQDYPHFQVQPQICQYRATSSLDFFIMIRKCPSNPQADFIKINTSNTDYNNTQSLLNLPAIIIPGDSSINQFMLQSQFNPLGIGFTRVLINPGQFVFYYNINTGYFPIKYFFDEHSNQAYFQLDYNFYIQAGLATFKSGVITIHDSSNYEIYSNWVKLVARGFYLAQLFQDTSTNISTLKIYHIKQKTYLFQESFSAINTVCHQINQTHILIGGSINNSLSFKIYDLRTFVETLNVSFPINSTQKLDSVFYTSSKILYLIKTKNTLFELTIQKKTAPTPNLVPSYNVCPSPMKIVNEKYCIQCGSSCLTCSISEPLKCETCIKGFILNNQFICIPDVTIQFIFDVISIPGFSLVFEGFSAFFKFTDRFWLFETINITYSDNVKGIFQAIRKSNSIKFFPNTLKINNITLFGQKQQNQTEDYQFRESMVSPFYLHTFQHVPYFLKYEQKVYFWGVISHISISIMIVLLGFLFRKTCLKPLFAKYYLLGFFIFELLSTRINYITFHFFSEIMATSAVNFHQKQSTILVTMLFFLILTFCFTFYGLLYWHYRTRDKTIFFCRHLKNTPGTFRYETSVCCLNFCQSVVHALVYYNSSLQLILLLILNFIHFLILTRHSYIFEMKSHFFVYLFHQVSRFLFLLTLIFHSMNEVEIFEIDIHKTEVFLLVLIVVFVILEILSNYYITIKRLIRNYYIEKQKEQQEERNQLVVNAFLNVEKGLMENITRVKSRDNTFFGKNNKRRTPFQRDISKHKSSLAFTDLLINSKKEQKSVKFKTIVKQLSWLKKQKSNVKDNQIVSNCFNEQQELNSWIQNIGRKETNQKIEENQTTPIAEHKIPPYIPLTNKNINKKRS